MSITKQSALPLINRAKSETMHCFPQYAEMIAKLGVHLISKTHALEKRNEIAASIGAFELFDMPRDHMETLIGDTQDAVAVYYQTIKDESEFVHYLIHEFGHVISIRASFDVYQEVQKDIAYDIDSKRRAGASIWSEFIAEYIALQVENQPPQEITWGETDRLQWYLDQAVGSGSFDYYPYAFYLANYFGNQTIYAYLMRNPGAAIGFNNYDDALVEISGRAVNTLGEQILKDEYWIIDFETLEKLGDSFNEFWDFCELAEFSRRLKQMKEWGIE